MTGLGGGFLSSAPAQASPSSSDTIIGAAFHPGDKTATSNLLPPAGPDRRRPDVHLAATLYF